MGEDVKTVLKVSVIVTASVALLVLLGFLVGGTKDLGVGGALAMMVASSLILFGTVYAVGWVVWLITSTVQAYCEKSNAERAYYERLARND
jgi:peptidoglycan biosynthesis protein MviN/MurJ (putative lipid II flippase)